MHRWRSWLAVAAIVTTTPLLAQSSTPTNAARPLPPASAAQPDPPSIGLGELTRRLTVPVVLGNKGPFPFLVDTGAERSVVSRELAVQLGLDRGPSARLFDFSGSSVVDTVRVPSLSAGPLGATAIDAPLLAAANIGAPGMLGIDALQGHKVVIDFDRRRMSVVTARRHARGETVVGADRRLGQLILTKAWFNGQPISVVIDTGSWISVGNSAMRALATRTPRRIGPISVQSVTGRTFDADFVSIGNVRIGDLRFDDFGLAFADVPPFERFGLRDKPALILGLSSLRPFGRIEIDFVNREIGFTLSQAKINFHDTCRGMSACKRL